MAEYGALTSHLQRVTAGGDDDVQRVGQSRRRTPSLSVQVRSLVVEERRPSAARPGVARRPPGRLAGLRGRPRPIRRGQPEGWRRSHKQDQSPAAVKALRSLASFTPTGEELRSEVSFVWLAAGGVTFDGTKLIMPKLTFDPGVYRFTFSAPSGEIIHHYVGETDNLDRRLGTYRNPGRSQPTNVRLNALLTTTVEGGGKVTVCTVLEGSFLGRPLDFRSKPGRLLVESAALLSLAADGMVVENLKTESALSSLTHPPDLAALARTGHPSAVWQSE